MPVGLSVRGSGQTGDLPRKGLMLGEALPSRLLKKALGEGTGLAKRAEFTANPVGRVPSRGIVRVFQQPARAAAAAALLRCYAPLRLRGVGQPSQPLPRL